LPALPASTDFALEVAVAKIVFCFPQRTALILRIVASGAVFMKDTIFGFPTFQQ
jgi:hypothetical protein